jgi:hypothetical protein
VAISFLFLQELGYLDDKKEKNKVEEVRDDKNHGYNVKNSEDE